MITWIEPYCLFLPIFSTLVPLNKLLVPEINLLLYFKLVIRFSQIMLRNRPFFIGLNLRIPFRNLFFIWYLVGLVIDLRKVWNRVWTCFKVGLRDIHTLNELIIIKINLIIKSYLSAALRLFFVPNYPVLNMRLPANCFDHFLTD